MTQSVAKVTSLQLPLVSVASLGKVPALTPRHSAEELLSVLARALDSQQFILGPEVERFEANVASTLGVKHALGEIDHPVGTHRIDTLKPKRIVT